MKKLIAAVSLTLLATAYAKAQTPITVQSQPPAKKVAAVIRFETCTKPEWPKEALRKEQTGTVHLSFLIDEDGKIAESKIEKSSGYELLDNAARDGIAKCRFIPQTVDGKPTASWAKMQYVWSFEDGELLPEEKLAQQKLARKDFAGAAAAFRTAAEKGSAEAQFQLARLLFLGTGVGKDTVEARNWLEKAASHNHILANAAYGQLLFDDGNKDEEAFRMLTMASINGVPSATFYLGMCFEYGRGTARDIGQAKDFYRVAAKGGISEAKTALDELEAQ
jgi:TonB family protein